jgi:amidase
MESFGARLPSELWRWTARDLARGIRLRQISSREVVESCLRRIDDVNPKVNALVEISREEALARADAADRAVSAGDVLGALHGVPTSIKVNTDETGHATTNGIVAFREAIAAVDAPQVQKLRDAGAVFAGRSNTPAFSFRWFTANDLHGKTLNPWDTRRTPGGSSGGAAAAVASGMVPFAHGNDFGGSIRYPAYACGIVGIRPTVGRVPSWVAPTDANESMSGQTMVTQGPLARSVDDLRLVLDAMSGFDARDPSSVPVPPLSANPPMVRPIRVGVLTDIGVVRPEPAIRDALDTAASWLADAGYAVEPIELPFLAEAWRLWWLLAMEEFRQWMPMVEEHGDHAIRRAAAHYYEVSKAWWGVQPGLVDYMNGYARRGTLIARLQQFLERNPLVLLPVSAELPFEQDADLGSVERTRQVIAAQWSMMAIPLVGFPAVAVPTGVSEGLPVGVQLLAQKFREDLLLDAAEVIEGRAGRFTPIDPRNR